MIVGAQIAPVMRGCFIQRCLQIIAQRGGQRGFVAVLHTHRVNQRREQAFAFGVQQIAQRLHFGGAVLHIMFGAFQRRAGRGLRGLGAGQLFARGGCVLSQTQGRRAGFLGLAIGAGHVGRALGGFHRRIEARAGIRQLAGGSFQQGVGNFTAAFVAGLVGVPIGETGVQFFQQAFGVGKRCGQARGVFFRSGNIRGGALRRFRQAGVFFRKRGEGGAGVIVQALFTLDIGTALGDELANTLRRFAGAGFFLFQLFALHDQAVMGGGFFRFRLAQGRQNFGCFALYGAGAGGNFGGAGHGGGSSCEVTGGGGGARLAVGPAQEMRQRFGFADMARQVAVARRLARLALEAGKLAVHFADDIFQP